jgi:hypothetical protein
MVKKIALEEHVLRGVRAEPDAKIARRQARDANGICSAGPLIWAIAASGPDRVTFAADYPFDATEEAPISSTGWRWQTRYATTSALTMPHDF